MNDQQLLLLLSDMQHNYKAALKQLMDAGIMNLKEFLPIEAARRRGDSCKVYALLEEVLCRKLHDEPDKFAGIVATFGEYLECHVE